MAKPNKMHRFRLWAAYLIVSLILFALIGRLAYIQVIHNEFYLTKALSHQIRDIPLPALRGDILDRNGMKLAFSMSTFTVWARPADISDAAAHGEALSTILDEPAETIAARIGNKESTLVRVAKGLTKSKADLVRNKSLKGVWVTESSKRSYPYGSFASHIIGHSTEDGEGLSGVEQIMNEALSGLDGKIVSYTDAAGRTLPTGEEKVYAPVNGYNVVLTIDEVIQHFTEKAVEGGLKDFGALRIMAVVMDPMTGEILAMTTKPDYDPNTPRDLTTRFTADEIAAMDNDAVFAAWNQIWRNPIVSDTYEPGSTFKLITSAAGLEENKVTMNSTFYDKGYVIVNGVRINCWRRNNPHGLQTLTQGLENSCNPVFIEIAQRLGKDSFYDYIEDFGFTEKTGILLPAEGNALVHSRDRMGPIEMATVAFGHGVSTTPIQVVTAVSAIVNGGNLMQPLIVKAMTDENGNVVESFEPKIKRQVISEETSNEMKKMMESVVLKGSGKKAYIPGIGVGGKTGTTEKLIDGKYSKDLAYASFVGFAPVEDPKIVVLVIVDEPRDTNFGSVVAAPIAHNILLDTLRYLKVEPEILDAAKEVVVPDLTGKTFAQAQSILNASGLILNTVPVDLDDSGAIVQKQYPVAGERIRQHSIVILSFDTTN
jgi:stage V sporulation protein D (sporulation-specific penicillin-binding protein)